MEILNAKSHELRIPPYEDLLKVTRKTVQSAEVIASKLLKEAMLDDADTQNLSRMERCANTIDHYIQLAKRVISQTERRVLYNESVPSEEKIVSIFEPHTDIIVKDRRETLYGHKICLSTGPSGIITDAVVEEGNPSDSTLAKTMTERHKQLYGEAPKQAAMDGSFASRNNLTELKALGVEEVVFSKGRGLSTNEMAKNDRSYKLLRNFRAGIEGSISFLKRKFGLDRCSWRGLASFKAYVQVSVLACNLLVLARHIIASG